MAKIRPLFRTKAEKGKLVIYDKEKLVTYLSIKEGKELEMRLSEYRKKRSDEENRYYRGVVLPIIEDHTGQDDDSLHEFFKDKFLPKREIKVGNETRKVPISTTELSTIGMEEYLGKIREWSSQELECYIPLPNEFEKEPVTYYG